MESDGSFRVQKSPLLTPILSQMNPVHVLPNNFFQIHSNIILPYTPRHSERILPFKLLEQNFIYISHHPLVLNDPPISSCLIWLP